MALTWGMPYDLFWYGPIDAFWIYMKKAELEKEQEKTLSDFEAWRQGLYFRDALSSVYHIFNALADKNCKRIPYPEKPYGYKRQLSAEEQETYQNTLDAISAHNLILKSRIDSLKQGGHSD